MAANKKFTPRASTNLIEDEVTKETPIEETPTDAKAPTVEEAPVVEDKKSEDKTDVKVPVVEEKKADEVTFTGETTKKPIEKMVKICLAKKYDGCIGGEWYHFDKGQVVTVPENVKRILNRAEGMLKPL